MDKFKALVTTPEFKKSLINKVIDVQLYVFTGVDRTTIEDANQ